jgi:hypothetical protein
VVDGRFDHTRESERRAALRPVLCYCGHTDKRHPEFMEGECTAPGCGCRMFRPKDPAAVSSPVVPMVPPTAEVDPGLVPPASPLPALSTDEVLHAAVQSGKPALVKPAEAALRAVTEVHQVWLLEQRITGLRMRIEWLTAELQQARDELAALESESSNV